MLHSFILLDCKKYSSTQEGSLITLRKLVRNKAWFSLTFLWITRIPWIKLDTPRRHRSRSHSSTWTRAASLVRGSRSSTVIPEIKVTVARRVTPWENETKSPRFSRKHSRLPITLHRTSIFPRRVDQRPMPQYADEKCAVVSYGGCQRRVGDGGAGLKLFFFFRDCRWDERDEERRRGRGERGSACASVEDTGAAGRDAVRRAEDTEGVQLRGQEAARAVRLQQVRKIVHEEGLAAAARPLGVRQGATVPVPVLPATVQAEGPLAAAHPPAALRQDRGHGVLSARLHAEARDSLSRTVRSAARREFKSVPWAGVSGI